MKRSEFDYITGSLYSMHLPFHISSTQQKGMDFLDTYSAVVRIFSIRILLALVLIHNLFIHQMDVKIALMNGDLEEEIYMTTQKGT